MFEWGHFLLIGDNAIFESIPLTQSIHCIEFSLFTVVHMKDHSFIFYFRYLMSLICLFVLQPDVKSIVILHCAISSSFCYVNRYCVEFVTLDLMSYFIDRFASFYYPRFCCNNISCIDDLNSSSEWTKPRSKIF